MSRRTLYPFPYGSPPPIAPSPNFLVPEPFNTTDQILERFASVGFSPQEGVALLSSHSITGADTVDPGMVAGRASLIHRNPKITYPKLVELHSTPFLLRLTVDSKKYSIFDSSSDNVWLANIFIDVLLKGTLFPGYAISSFVLIFAHMAIIEMIPDRESSRQLSTALCVCNLISR
jgi:manganese peroxidase